MRHARVTKCFRSVAGTPRLEQHRQQVPTIQGLLSGVNSKLLYWCLLTYWINIFNTQSWFLPEKKILIALYKARILRNFVTKEETMVFYSEKKIFSKIPVLSCFNNLHSSLFILYLRVSFEHQCKNQSFPYTALTSWYNVMVNCFLCGTDWILKH